MNEDRNDLNALDKAEHFAKGLRATAYNGSAGQLLAESAAEIANLAALCRKYMDAAGKWDGEKDVVKRYDLFQVHLCGQNARGEMREAADGEYVEFDAYERAARWRRRCLSVIALLQHTAETGDEPCGEDWDMVREFERLGRGFDPSREDLVQKALSEAREVVGACAGENRPAPEWARKVRDRIDAALELIPRSEWVDTVMEDAVAGALDSTLFSDASDYDAATKAVREAVRLSGWAAHALPEDLFTHRSAWRRALGILRDIAEADDKSYWQHEIDAFDRTFSAIEALHPSANPAPMAVIEALRAVERVAVAQNDYFARKQQEYPSIEDYMDEDGILNLPEEISPLLSHEHYNGRYSEADWWVKTIEHMIHEAGRGNMAPGACNAAATPSANELKVRLGKQERAALRILPYLRWTVGPESPGHHPTMPSAVAAFQDAFGWDTDEKRTAAMRATAAASED